MAPSLGVEVFPINVLDARKIERAMTAFARPGNGGMVVTVSSVAVFHRDLIVALAARHKLPAVYAARDFVASGGLISYAADFVEQYRRAAGYVDRILKGEETGRPAGAGADQVSTGDQPQDREGARPRRAAVLCSPAPTR